MTDQEHHILTYKAFMIRLWQDDENAPWRASVQMVRTGETIHFASVLGLLGFLREQASPRHYGAVTEATVGNDTHNSMLEE